MSPKIFVYIEECTEYDRAIVVLNELFVKRKNEVFARHVLATRSQQIAESLDEYLQVLKTFIKLSQLYKIGIMQSGMLLLQDFSLVTYVSVF